MGIKKVLIYSRHGLRYPLFNIEKMSGIITRKEIDWEFEDSILTPKGEILEYQLGKYLAKYISNLGLKVKTKEFYTNSLKRTILTSKILGLAMFPYEDVKVNYLYNDLKTLDTNFNISVPKECVKVEKLRLMDEALKPAYTKLENILNIPKGKISDLKSSITIDDRGLIYSSGAFNIGTDLVDMFVLKFYEGFNIDKIFKSNDFRKDLKELSIIKDTLLDTLFADRDYIKNSEKNPYELLKTYLKKDNDLSVIVGHDSNISTILSALGIEDENLGNEFEKYPIGAKLVFKVYEDDSFDVDYVYYDVDTIRYMDGRDPICKTLAKKIRVKEL